MNKREKLDIERTAVAETLVLVRDEVSRAQQLGFGPARSAHEGYAIILEELDELKAWVWMKQKNRDILKMKKEAIEVAAMAVRFAAECDRPGWGRK